MRACVQCHGERYEDPLELAVVRFQTSNLGTKLGSSTALACTLSLCAIFASPTLPFHGWKHRGDMEAACTEIRSVPGADGRTGKDIPTKEQLG